MNVNETGPGYVQTLGNGLQVLEILRDRAAGATVTELADALAAHRTVVYRLLTTLRSHGFVTRDAGGRHHLGTALLALSSSVKRDLRTTAAPVLAALADHVQATAFLTVADGDEAVTVCVTEPRNGQLHAAYREGSRHPLTSGSSGLAILAGRPSRPDERAEIAQVRTSGYSVTTDELESGAWGLAMPLEGTGGWSIASVGVVALRELPLTPTVAAVAHAIQALGNDPLVP